MTAITPPPREEEVASVEITTVYRDGRSVTYRLTNPDHHAFTHQWDLGPGSTVSLVARSHEILRSENRSE
jgi:hypothetical protein